MKDLLEEIKQIKNLLYELKRMFTRCVSNNKNVVLDNKRVKLGKNDSYVNMKELRFISGEYVRQLTYNEAVVLNELINSEDNFCSYDYLCNILYGCENDAYAQHSLHTCISRLRRKTEGFIEIKSAKKKGFYIKFIDYEH